MRVRNDDEAKTNLSAGWNRQVPYTGRAAAEVAARRRRSLERAHCSETRHAGLVPGTCASAEISRGRLETARPLCRGRAWEWNLARLYGARSSITERAAKRA